MATQTQVQAQPETQTTLYPFNSYQADPTVHLVSDGIGNTIVLPKYGCLTWIEDDIINSYIINADTDQNGLKLPMSYAEAELVSRLLQFRKGIKPDQFRPKEEVLVIPSRDGSFERPMSSLLVHAIYEFFTIHEKSGWKQDSNGVIAPSPEQQAEINATSTASEKK